MIVSASTGAGAVLALTLILVAWRWYTTRETPWDTNALCAIWSEATETFELEATPRNLKHSGFELYFGLENRTSRDITIPTDAVIMNRLSKGGTLAEVLDVRLNKAYLIPAHQRAQITLQLNYGCGEEDLQTGAVHTRDAHICFDSAFAGSEGLALFDQTHRIQVNLPKPILRYPSSSSTK